MASASKDLTQGSPAKLLLGFALPMMVGSAFQQMYTMVDAAIIGRFMGVQALAAVGAADWFQWLVLSLMIGCAQGFAIIPSQRFGARDMDGLRKSSATAILLTAVMAAVLTAVSLPMVRPILKLMDTDSAIFDLSAAYVSVLFGGITVVALYNMFASLLRAIGNSRDPLIAMVIGACVNIVLDLLFVPVLQWGVAGAAAATVLGQGCACLYTLVRVLREPSLKFTARDWKLDFALMGQNFRLGVPMALQNAVIGVGGMAVQQVVNGYGYVFVAGFTAANKLWGLMELAAINYGYAISSYTGQNLGAGRFDRIQKGVRTGAVLGIATGAAVGLVMVLTGRTLVGLFISAEDPAIAADAVKVAYEYLTVMCVPLFILYLIYVYRSALQGSGDTGAPFLSGVLELVVRITVVHTLPAFFGSLGIFLAEPLAWLSADLILVPAYFLRIKRLRKESES